MAVSSATKGALRFQTRQGADMVVPYSSAALAAADAAAIGVAQAAGRRVFITTTDGMSYEINPNFVPESLGNAVSVTPA